jgi:hypothetical protein
LGCAAGAAAGGESAAGDCARAVADDNNANALAKPAMNRNMVRSLDDRNGSGPSAKVYDDSSRSRAGMTVLCVANPRCSTGTMPDRKMTDVDGVDSGRVAEQVGNAKVVGEGGREQAGHNKQHGA